MSEPTWVCDNCGTYDGDSTYYDEAGALQLGHVVCDDCERCEWNCCCWDDVPEDGAVNAEGTKNDQTANERRAKTASQKT